MLNTGLIVRRRIELGLSVRTFAKQLGVTGAVVRNLEAGSNHTELTIGLLARLATTLAVDITDLLHDSSDADRRAGNGSNTETAAASRAARLGVVLHTVGVLYPLTALCEVFGWTLDELDTALADLEHALRPAGLRLHQQHRSVQIVRRVAAADQHVLQSAMRKHINRDGLNLSEARLLKRILDGNMPKEPSNAERVALGVLTNAGLLTAVNEMAFRLAPEVQYGMQHQHL